MNRAQFLRSLAAGVGGLLVGNDALEAFERLTHKRRFFPGWSESRRWVYRIEEREVAAYIEAQRRGALYTFQEVDTPTPRVLDRFSPDVFDMPRIRSYTDVRIVSVEQPYCQSPRVTFST